jgi:4-amino-4-deoxy-L-arabinose transferase-like glycosyltransferase
MAEPRTRPGWALALPVLGAAALAVFVAMHVSRDIPFDSDEANHANIALRQFEDLRDGRFADFLRHSFRTGQFPFLHGWTVLPWMAAFGTTMYAARVAQCLAFVVGAGATGWAAYRAGGGDRRAGFIGASLFALCPLLATYSGLCMLETPGAAATALSLACFAEACCGEGRRRWIGHAFTAGVVLAAYFIKVNYGLWIAPAVGLGYVLRWLRSESRRDALRDGLVYAGVVLGVLALWYAAPSQRAAFTALLHNPAQAISVESDDPTFHVPGVRLGNFTAYFGIVATDFHLHWTIGVAAFAAFAWGLWERRRNSAVGASAACLAWTWLVLSMGFREYPLPRFIATATPAFWIVAAVGASDVLSRAGSARWLSVAGSLALAAGLAAQMAALPRLMEIEYEIDTRFVPVFDFLADTIRPKTSVLVVGYTDHTSARTLDWWLGAREGSAWRDYDVVGLNSERIFESDRRVGEWMSQPRPWGEPGWTSEIVEFTTGPRYADRDIVVEATAKMWHDALRRYAPRLVRVGERRFEDLDVTVTVWRDMAPPPHEGLRSGK